MHDLGETVPPDFYVWRLILIEVDRVSRLERYRGGGGFPSHLRVHRQIRLYRSHKTRCAVNAENDFNREKLHVLSLPDSIFGGLKEALDSDIDIPELPPTADISFIGTLFSQRGVQGARPHSCYRGVRSRPLVHPVISIRACPRACDYSERGYEGEA